MIVRAPFVIAGDAPEAELERWHDRTIGPAARAMARSYFRTPPNQPVTVLLFSGDQSYNRYAKALYGDEGISIYGYYKPRIRTLVMNIGTGGGTLVHELTHALMDFDFPDVPDWFNEGLASLHEQCDIRADEPGIVGLVNWRLPILKRALDEGRLPSLETLATDPNFRGQHEAVHYAQARYLCLYLQEQGLLDDYFHRFRAARREDPRGQATLLAMFPGKTWAQLDSQFQEWVRGLRGAR